MEWSPAINPAINPAWYYSKMVINTEDSEHDDKDVEMPPDVRGDGCLNTADGWLLGWWSRAPATCYCLLFGLRCVRISTSRTERGHWIRIIFLCPSSDREAGSNEDHHHILLWLWSHWGWQVERWERRAVIIHSALYQRSYFHPFMATAMVQSFNT